MPTTVNKTIGATGRDYATYALAISALPASLVTADQVWMFAAYNDGAFSFSTGLSITVTTDATRFIDFDVGAGQGFASAGSPVGAAAQSRGVYLNCTGYAQAALTVSTDTFKLHNHQIVQTGGGTRAAIAYTTGGSNNSLLENIICESPDVGPQTRYGIIRNCLSIVRGNNSNSGWYFNYYIGGTVACITVVRPTTYTAAGNGFQSDSAITMKDCASFGFTGFKTGGGTFSGNNNGTDLASVGFGSSNTTSVAFSTSTFVGVTNAAGDFRIITGSALKDAGATDTTTIPAAVDAWGTSRPQGSAWDIGFHEFVSGGGPTTVPLTGVSGTGSVGTLGVQHKNPLTSISGTGSLGTLAPKQTKALTGVAGTGSVGTLGVLHKNALTGISGTGSLGTLTPLSGFNVPLTGVQGTGSVGTLGVQHKNPLTGIQATGQLGTLTPTSTGGSVSIPLTGIQARGFLGTLTPSGGVIIDTHDGGVKRKKQHDKLQKKLINEERERQERRRQQMIEAFERVIEGRPDIPDAISAIEVIETIEVAQPEVIERIEASNFPVTEARVEALWAKYLEIDDEEVLVLL